MFLPQSLLRISLLRILLSIFIIIPLLASVLLYFLQDYLLFIQRPIDDNLFYWLKNQYPNSEVQVTTPDKVLLHGWFVKKTSEAKAPLIIYFGGNAEEISWFLWEDIEKFRGWAVLLVNYRGYGLSQGLPSEKNLFQDALFLYDTFSKREDIDQTRIVALARSLGTGVAVYLASQRLLKGVILVSPYESVQSVAQKIYFFVPVKWLLKHPFNSLERAPKIKIPLLAIIASQDEKISPDHSWALMSAWGGKTYQTMIEQRGHNDIQTGTGYWESIVAFLEKMRQGS